MRQIHVCAWLLVLPLFAVACGGEQFTSGDSGSAEESGVGADKSFGPPSRGDAGATTDDGKTETSGGSSHGGGTSSAGTGPSAPSSAGSKSIGLGGGGGGDACAMGTVTFRMIPDAGLPEDYLCDAGCGTGWLTLTDAKGAGAFSLFPACGSTSCDSCSPLACAAAACLPTALTSKGSELTWAGTYLAQGKCGMNTACQKPTCLAPGKYKAKACAAVSAGKDEMSGGTCSPQDTQLCAETEFEFPGTSEVKLLLKK